MNKRPMTNEEFRTLAYDALSDLDDLVLSEPEDELAPELQDIRAKLFRLACGVIWDEVDTPNDPRAKGGIGYDGAPGPGPGE